MPHETPTSKKLSSLAHRIGLFGNVQVADEGDPVGRYFIKIDGENHALGDSAKAAEVELRKLAKIETPMAASEIERRPEVDGIELPADVIVKDTRGMVRYIVLSIDPFSFQMQAMTREAVANKALFLNKRNAALFINENTDFDIEVPPEPESEEKLES